MNRPRSRQGGRPASSRTVRLVPLRRTGLDHRELARVLLAVISSVGSPVGNGTDKKVSSAWSNDPDTTPASEDTTATSAALTGPSTGRAAGEEGRS